MNNIAVVDCNNIAHIAAHSIPLLSSKEHLTNVIFGFLNSIFNIQKRFNPDRIVFCWDSKKSFRKMIYPGYKSKRHDDKTDEEKECLHIIYEQFTELRKIVLPGLGFKNIFMSPGYEADDLIADIVKNNKSVCFTIISTDQDLYQLLEKRVICSNPITKKALTRSLFIEKYGIKPEQWGAIKAIGGCGSDNVIGIKGVGEKTAIKYLNNLLPKKSKAYKTITSKEGDLTIKTNFPLVNLPFKGTQKLNAELVVQPDLLKRDFTKIFNNYSFESFLKPVNLDQWVQVFDLKMR